MDRGIILSKFNPDLLMCRMTTCRATIVHPDDIHDKFAPRPLCVLTPIAIQASGKVPLQPHDQHNPEHRANRRTSTK